MRTMRVVVVGKLYEQVVRVGLTMAQAWDVAQELMAKRIFERVRAEFEPEGAEVPGELMR